MKSLLRDRFLLFLLVFSLLVKLFSLREDWVEQYYTYGFYPIWASLARTIFGWLPFSFGDLLYLLAAAWLCIKTWKWLGLLIRRQARKSFGYGSVARLLKIFLCIYLFFNLSWGLNYDRLGIAHQVGIRADRYNREELVRLTEHLQYRLNSLAASVDTVNRDSMQGQILHQAAIANYKSIAASYPFLRYSTPSIKPSLYSAIGHYFGFSGYFNPFTHEAQLNTSEPSWVKPFVFNHEIAHGLGYGKENEASFVSFLVSKENSDLHFRYSLYYELYFNAFGECTRATDSTTVARLKSTLHPRAKRDKLTEIQFRFKRKNALQPYVSDFYDNYLRLNNQPNGLATYNEVTALLIAYVRKYGVDAL